MTKAEAEIVVKRFGNTPAEMREEDGDWIVHALEQDFRDYAAVTGIQTPATTPLPPNHTP